MGPNRKLCLALVVGSGLVFAVVAGLLVPWHWVPGGHYEHVSAHDVFSAAQIKRGTSYSSSQRHLGWASLAVALVVALLLGLTRLGRLLLGRLRGPWWFRVVLGTLALLVIGVVVTLPFSWRSRSIDLAYGLTNQAAAGWWGDLGLTLLVNWAFTAIAMLMVMGVARKAPRTWPLWTGLAAVPLVFAGSFVYPVVVEPLFNHFTPMPKGELRNSIMALAAKEHVHISDVLVADASRRTTTLNAYVSGFGSTRRVVVYDNLLTDVNQAEVEAVVAHELGHAAHNDVLLGTGLGAIGSVFGLGLLGLLFADRRLLARARVSGPGDPVAIAMLLALTALGTLLASPIENTISRGIEARADRSSLAATGNPAAFIAMQKSLAVHSLSDPTPPAWSEFWFGNHPTALQRIGMAKALERQ
jgi:STE24 endopeptidase